MSAADKLDAAMVEPRWKQGLPARKPKGGRARPDEPLRDWCEVAVAGVCWGRADQRHHKLRRSQGGSDEQANTLDVCTGCHDHLHRNVSWAVERGYLTRRGT